MTELDYDTCEKLKAAGFPFTLQVTECCEGASCSIHYYDKDMEPTLSQLIKACGDNLISFSLVRSCVVDEGGRISWRAQNSHGQWLLGKTPEEAVANLYLKLN